MLSYSRLVERCRPLLGTFVRIRVHGLAPERARVAIDEAFGEIAAVHRLMSFHERDSDISRLNREAHLEAVTVDQRTAEVLARARVISFHSSGAFDITVAPQLVKAGTLRRPYRAIQPDPDADWRDVVILQDGLVQFRRPLWIDLGGIAKGYAVDRAITILRKHGPTQACVNAGGDLRVIGSAHEIVKLAAGECRTDQGALVEIEDGSIASSCGPMIGRHVRRGAHVDPLGTGRPAQFVCVAAPRCIDADALTKVVMVRGHRCTRILAHYQARAVVHDTRSGWRAIGGVGQ